MLFSSSNLVSSLVLSTLACLSMISAQNFAYPESPNSAVFHRLESFPHSLKKPFLDKYFSSRFYDYGGDTLIKSDSFIRLTGDRPGEAGWLFSKLPALPEHFQVEFDFKIHGEGSSLYGDGLAMWITTHKGELGPVFGSSDQFQGLGIFFDTYKNHRPGKTFPYVMAMVGDGKTFYDGANDGLANEVAGCSARGLHNPKDISHARLTYVKGKFLSFDLDYKTKNEEERKWVNCFVIDADTAALPSSALFLGFSARTGQLSENHDIHRVQVFSLRNPPDSYQGLLDIDNGKTPRIEGKKASYDYFTNLQDQNKSGSSWTMFFMKIIGFLAVLIIALFAYGLYSTKVKERREMNKNEYYMSY